MYSRVVILSKVSWNFPFMNLVSQGSQEDFSFIECSYSVFYWALQEHQTHPYQGFIIFCSFRNFRESCGIFVFLTFRFMNHSFMWLKAMKIYGGWIFMLCEVHPSTLLFLPSCSWNLRENCGILVFLACWSMNWKLDWWVIYQYEGNV